jgi:hypothetical protein
MYNVNIIIMTVCIYCTNAALLWVHLHHVSSLIFIYRSWEIARVVIINFCAEQWGLGEQILVLHNTTVDREIFAGKIILFRLLNFRVV